MSPHAGPAAPLHWSRSLRFRLLAVTLAGVAIAILLAGFVLSGLFRDQVHRQFETALMQQLDQVTARLDFDAQGQPVIATQALSDPRWLKPYSGLYWQVDAVAPEGLGRAGVLRSRSLWDTSLALQVDTLVDGAVHVHQVPGPQGVPLLVLERIVRAEGGGVGRWRLVVAADLQATQAATAQFNRVLALSLAVLLVLLAAAAWAQVALGLQPLRALQHSLQDVQQARATHLLGTFPAEVQPLVDDFNAVLDRNAEVVQRARTQAGNLAHALKTPLTVLVQAAGVPQRDHGEALAGLVSEQVQVARRHIDWHLARSRVAATAHIPGQRVALEPVVDGLVRVMNKVHAERGVDISVVLPEMPLFFAGETQDLQEMLGNLLDNACKWARSTVRLRAQAPAIDPDGVSLCPLLIKVEDDGCGMDAAQRQQAVVRGVRLDETVPGTGLGLAIVRDLAALYGGCLDLELADLGGLCAVLTLPASPVGPAPALARK